MVLPDQLIEAIVRIEPPVIIAVSGFGGAGKSSFAATLGHRIDAPVVGVDAFIIDRTMTRFTHWELIDFDRLEREVLQPYTKGCSVRYGIFDWAANTIREVRELSPTPRIIVEGVGLFRPSLLKYFAALVWVDCPLDEAIRRGKKRDREEYHNPQDKLWDGVWRENDVACFHEYRPREIAGFVINNAEVGGG